MKTYTTKLKFKDHDFEIGIIPVEGGGFDLEVVTKGRMSGDMFQSLRKYLDEEGYLEAAREFVKI